MSKVYIDLHIHSQDSNNTGSTISNHSDLQMLQKLVSNHVRVACFADHDNLFIDSYNRRNKIIEQNGYNLTLLPGCEINLFNGSKSAQAILVFKPDQDLIKIKKMVNKNKLTYRDVFTKFSEFDFMIFPHTGKGKDIINPNELNQCYITGFDSSNPKSRNLKKAMQLYPWVSDVYFSDVHNWNKYPFDNNNYRTAIEWDENLNNANSIYEYLKKTFSDKTKIYKY
ncbi:hypothetical protein EG856_00075 [Mycoplasmopsis phocirhinis]|uniref:PHP domain-containing protein n=1 Tax=Mycoplasmopsis phocirhinis TaxID=142650 RepID=A0A4P6MLJ0_9BACT|nr:hypothetical protein [Mycoplasmopsis phocirhinis]QBF34338.1 hypothetical protein EG856_00075 [Mycoplasmopsis phocirhinis]